MPVYENKLVNLNFRRSLKMKRLVLSVLSITLLIGLSGCSNDKNTNNPIKYDCSGMDSLKGVEFSISLNSDGRTDSDFTDVSFNGWKKKNNGDIFIQTDTKGDYKMTKGSVTSGLTDANGKGVALCFLSE